MFLLICKFKTVKNFVDFKRYLSFYGMLMLFLATVPVARRDLSNERSVETNEIMWARAQQQQATLLVRVASVK